MTTLMQFGPYALGQAIAEQKGVSKFSFFDRLLDRSKTAGETLYRVDERIQFLGASWYLVLGVFQGHIFKLSARWSSTTQAPHTAMMFEVVDYCRNHFGTNMTGSKDDAAIWKTDFGIVTLNAKSSVHSASGRGTYLIILESTAQLKVGGSPPHAKN